MRRDYQTGGFGPHSEGFGVLDNSNIPKVLELLQTIKSKFRAVLIVSHIEEIKEVAARIVTIRDDGMESSVNC